MEYMQWDETFSVGVEHLDNHHRKLLVLLNEARAVLETPRDTGGTARILRQLFDYVSIHFASEEEWMRDVEYPLQRQHLIQHQDFLHSLTSIQQTYASAASTRSTAALDMFILLQNWLVEHIIGSDGMIASYVRRYAA